MHVRLIVVLVGLLLATTFAGVGGSGAARFQDGETSTLIVAVSRDPQNLDPTSASSDGFTSEILTNIYHWLIDYELVTGEDGQPIFSADDFVGDIAESFEVQDDGRTVVFKIREGLTFSNGDPIDANVVKFTYDRIFDQGTTTAVLTRLAEVSGKDSVQVIDDYTVEFTIDEPNTLLFGNLAQYGHSILNPLVLEPHMTEADPAAHEWLSTNTAGNETGPYMLESWEPGVEFVLVANPNWHGEPARTDRIIFRVVPDASTRLSLLRSGEVDIARDIAPRDLQELENDPDITVYRFPSRVVSFIGMNATMPPFDDPLVRQAISYAIPYQTIIDNALFGYAIPLTSVIPEGMDTHTDEFFVYETDPERARELLAEAGFPDGLDVTFQVRSDLAESKAIGVWMKSELAKAGINVTIQELDGATFTGGLQRKEYAFFHHPGWLSINNDPFYHVSFLLQSECCNYTEYANEEVSQLIEEFTISTDEEGRAEASRRIQEIAAEEAVWGLLYQPDTTLATRADIKGVTFNPADRYWRYYLMYKE